MKYSISIILALLLSGCSQNKNSQSKITDLEVRVAELEKQLANIEKNTNYMASSLVKLEQKIRTKIDAKSVAHIDTSSKKYGIARNEYGSFPILVDDAQPYLDGHKVKFRVGNLTSATMSNVKLEITYGATDPSFPVFDESLSHEERLTVLKEYHDKLESNQKIRRSLTAELASDLAPGMWNVVEVIISPSTPNDLGDMEVRVSAQGMKLTPPDEN